MRKPPPPPKKEPPRTETQNARERLSALTGSFRHAVFVVKGDRFAFVNKATVAISGYSESELYGMKFYDLVHEEFRERAKRQVFARQRGRAVEPLREIKIVTREGRCRWLEFSARRLKYEGSPAVLGTAFDVTERKRTEEALRESEEKYRLLAENALDVIWTAELHPFRLDYVSPSIRRLLDRTPEECLAMSLGDILTPESQENVGRALAEAQEVEADPEPPKRALRQMMEVELVRKDGAKRWCEVTVNFLRDRDGKPTGLLGVARDITKRKKAAEEKGLLESQLREAKKFEALGRLSGGIAHDFRNFLNSIAAFAQNAREHSDGNGKVADNLDKIVAACFRARKLVERIQSFGTRKSCGFKPLSLAPIVDEALQLIEPMIGDGIRVKKRFCADAGMVLGDSVQLHQTVANLLSNAVRAMRDGGGVLEVGLTCVPSEEAWDHRIPQSGNFVKLTVRDDGAGIPPEIMDRIFEPYFTTRKCDGGLGFGLALVMGAVQSHGGMITVDSAPGKGATFHVFLPEAC